MRYFFHLREGSRFTEDPEGTELPNLEAVRRETSLDARAIAAERIKNATPMDIGIVFEVVDENGVRVHTFPIAAIVLASFKSELADADINEHAATAPVRV